MSPFNREEATKKTKHIWAKPAVMHIDCPSCGGSGRKGRYICGTCSGSGKILINRR